MTTEMRGRVQRQKGQAAVEFALVAPVVFLLLFAVIEFGLLLYNYIEIGSAAREGARKAAVSRYSNDPVKDVRDAVQRSTSVVDDSRLSIAVSPGTPWSSGQDVTVTLSYPYSMNVMGVVVWSGNLRGTSIVRVE